MKVKVAICEGDITWVEGEVCEDGTLEINVHELVRVFDLGKGPIIGVRFNTCGFDKNSPVVALSNFPFKKKSKN